MRTSKKNSPTAEEQSGLVAKLKATRLGGAAGVGLKIMWKAGLYLLEDLVWHCLEQLPEKNLKRRVLQTLRGQSLVKNDILNETDKEDRENFDHNLLWSLYQQIMF